MAVTTGKPPVQRESSIILDMSLAPSPGTVRDIMEQIQIDRDKSFGLTKSGQRKIPLFRDYADGNHKLILAEGQKDVLSELLGNQFCDNTCHQVIAEGSDRLRLLRFDVEDGKIREGKKVTLDLNPEDLTKLDAEKKTSDGEKESAQYSSKEAKWLSNWYTMARLSDIAGEAHYNTLRDGDFALSLSWDEKRKIVKAHRESWWDGVSGMFVGYDKDGEMLYAVKEWQTETGRRRVLWFEGWVARFVSDGGDWVGYNLPEEELLGSVGPQRYENPYTGDGMHIPVVHFPNSGRGTTVYGTSELDGGVIGFQDQINDLQYDMSAAGRMTGFQMIFMSGVENAYDANGIEIQPIVGPGQFLKSANPESRATAIPAGDISQLILLYNQKLRSLARMTRTPLHSITGADWPSGEALLRSEMPAINKAERQIEKFIPSWSTLAHRAMEIANAFGNAGLDEKKIVRAVFSPPERRDSLSKSFIIRNLGGTMSIKRSLRDIGDSPEQAQDNYNELMREKEDELALNAKYDEVAKQMEAKRQEERHKLGQESLAGSNDKNGGNADKLNQLKGNIVFGGKKDPTGSKLSGSLTNSPTVGNVPSTSIP